MAAALFETNAYWSFKISLTYQEPIMASRKHLVISLSSLTKVYYSNEKMCVFCHCALSTQVVYKIDIQNSVLKPHESDYFSLKKVKRYKWFRGSKEYQRVLRRVM